MFIVLILLLLLLLLLCHDLLTFCFLRYFCHILRYCCLIFALFWGYFSQNFENISLFFIITQNSKNKTKRFSRIKCPEKGEFQGDDCFRNIFRMSGTVFLKCYAILSHLVFCYVSRAFALEHSLRLK